MNRKNYTLKERRIYAKQKLCEMIKFTNGDKKLSAKLTAFRITMPSLIYSDGKFKKTNEFLSKVLLRWSNGA